MPQEAFFEVTLDGYAEVRKNLGELADNLGAPRVPSMKCALFMQGQAMRAFNEGGLVEPWEGLSVFSRFVRIHRASAPNLKPVTMNDSGRLKNSILPFVEEGGLVAGVGTNVGYASLMQNGGVSEGGDVAIGSFQRKKPKSDALCHVSAYTMHIQGGHYVPARPFLPRDESDVVNLGWDSKFAEIFTDWLSEAKA